MTKALRLATRTILPASTLSTLRIRPSQESSMSWLLASSRQLKRSQRSSSMQTKTALRTSKLSTKTLDFTKRQVIATAISKALFLRLFAWCLWQFGSRTESKSRACRASLKERVSSTRGSSLFKILDSFHWDRRKCCSQSSSKSTKKWLSSSSNRRTSSSLLKVQDALSLSLLLASSIKFRRSMQKHTQVLNLDMAHLQCSMKLRGLRLYS